MSTLQAMQAHPTGALRVTSPVVLGQAFVQDIVADYMASYPDVTIKLELTGRRVDIIEEGFDIAIRVGTLPDSGLALTRLGDATSGFYAAPSYLAAADKIDQPDHLQSHPLLLPGVSSDGIDLDLKKADRRVSLNVKPRLVCNDVQPLLTAAVRGLGVAQLPKFSVQADLNAHQLVPVLTDWVLPSTQINGLTPAYRGTIPSVREFLALAKKQLARVM